MPGVFIRVSLSDSRYGRMSREKCDLCGPFLVRNGLVPDCRCRQLLASVTNLELEFPIYRHAAN